MYRISRIIASVFIIHAFLLVAPVHADTTADSPDTPTLKIALEPSNFRLSLDPGDHYSGSFKIKNLGEIPYDVNVYAEPYQVEDLTYEVDFDTDNIFTQISRWISFEKTEYHLEPRDIVTVTFSIDVPEDVAGGGQYAAIFAEVKDTSDTTQVKVDRRVGTLLYSSVSGTAKRSGSIDFTAPAFLQLTTSPTFFETAKNSGNVDFDITTHLRLTNLLTNDVVADLDAASRVILPETSRSLDHNLSDVPVGFYRLDRSAEIHGELFEASHIIFVCPLPLLIAIIITIITIIILIIRSVLRSHRRRSRARLEATKIDNFPPPNHGSVN